MEVCIKLKEKVATNVKDQSSSGSAPSVWL